MRFVLKAAECCLFALRFDKALTLLDQCESEHGSMVQIELFRAHIDICRGQLDQATEHLNRAASMADNSPLVHLKIGELHRRKREFALALESFNRMVSLDPDNPLGHAHRAEVLLKMKDFEGAADAALTATERLFFLPQAHLTLGLAVARMDDLEQAIQCVEVAARQMPSWVSAHRLLVTLYTMVGRAEDAQPRRQTVRDLQRQAEATRPSSIKPALAPE